MPDRAAFSGPIGEICGLEGLARPLADKGRRPYVIHSAPGHPPIGGLGYVLDAEGVLVQTGKRIGDNGIWRIAKRNGILYLLDVGSKTTSFFSAFAGIFASN